MGKGDVVAAHALELLKGGHGARGERYADQRPAGEKRIHQLALGRHHLHAERLSLDLGNRDQFVSAQEIDGLPHQIADHVGLLARRGVPVLDLVDRPLPIVAEPQGARGVLHFRLAPGELLVGQLDQLLGGIGDHFLG